jgi:hypothetical protein
MHDLGHHQGKDSASEKHRAHTRLGIGWGEKNER